MDTGTRLGSYEIIDLLGKGGMGEVYRAFDTRLNRAVAVKVLPASFGNDRDRMARFEREARVLASLNHSGIAAIYGLEESGNAKALVMELVEGPTLADRLGTSSSSPISLEEILAIARQIAEVLEYAHEKGVIHRDLKPANVKVTSDRGVKVLDFGLAKAMQEERSQPDELLNSPTLNLSATAPGVILGTAAYMSPEQARGKAVDKRADIWSFGVLLFEMLAGRRPFDGEDLSETMAAVIKEEPDWGLLPGSTPAVIERLLRRCLAKNPKSRLRDIGDARLEIESALQEPAPRTVIPKQSRLPVWIGLAAGLLLGVLVTAPLWRFSAAVSSSDVVRAEVSLDPVFWLGASGEISRPSRTAIALLPDGKSLVFCGTGEKDSKLYQRRLDRWEALPIAGTEKGQDPFLSPDGQWVGFWADQQLKKVPIQGGTPVTLCDKVVRPWGVDWGSKGKIVFSIGRELQMVPAEGGQAEVLLARDLGKGELNFAQPHFLPGLDTLLFSTQTSPSRWDNPRLETIELKSRQRKVLLEEGADAHYADSGHLLFIRQGTLYAVLFDLTQMVLKSRPVPVLPNVMQAINASNSGSNSYASQISVSGAGTLAYVPGGPYRDYENWLLSIGAEGVMQPLVPASAPYFAPRLSPDGKKVIYQTLGKKNQIWVLETERRITTPLVVNDFNSWPIWTPDGRRVTFVRLDSKGHYRLLWMNPDSSEEPEVLIDQEKAIMPSSWSPDGEHLACVASSPETRHDVWIFHIKGRKEEPFIASRFAERYPDFSPDGKWIAYDSDESGKFEVYMRSFPDGRQKFQISSSGGTMPCWKRDGRQIVYLDSQYRLMSVDVTAGPRFGAPQVLLDYYGFFPSAVPIRGYDLYPDGSRVLFPGHFYGGKPIPGSEVPDAFKAGSNAARDPRMRAHFEYWIKSDPQRKISQAWEDTFREPMTTRIQIVQNWFEELKRLAP